MKLVEYKTTVCPYCKHPKTRTLDTWKNAVATMRLHECRDCRARFVSKQPHPTKTTKTTT